MFAPHAVFQLSLGHQPAIADRIGAMHSKSERRDLWSILHPGSMWLQFALLLSVVLAVGTACTGDDPIAPGVQHSLLSSECEDILPTALCEELRTIHGELAGRTGVCEDAAAELFQRLNDPNPSDAFGYDPNDPDPSWVFEVGGVVEYRLWFSSKFLNDPFFYARRRQIVVHELVGHYLEGYDDEYMAEIDFGSECNVPH